MPYSLNRICTQLMQWARPPIAGMEQWISPAFDLLMRLYLGQVFIASGLTKIQDWSVTLALFSSEYHVPLLPPAVAAVLGTGAELILPVFVILGLATRFGAAGLFVLNLMAVISYPELSELGRQDHLLWGSMLAVIVFHGGGRWSLDRLISRRCQAGTAGERN